MTASSGSSDSDEAFVPEEEEEEKAAAKAPPKAKEQGSASSGRTKAKGEDPSNAAWKDLNQTSSVSKQAMERSQRLLKALTSRKTSKASAISKKRKQVHEFQMPVLGLDVKKRRQDLDVKPQQQQQPQNNTIKFAGVEYNVPGGGALAASKKTDSSSSTKAKATSLDQVVASLDAPKKINTMEKTSLDWDKFKEKEGIQDELTQYTKDGYIEKQEFLQRLDLKRFELEKAERDRQRQLKDAAG